MLKWSGDFTLPRFRAKLANKYLLHPDVEPDYNELYRSDLSQSVMVRKGASGAFVGSPHGSPSGSQLFQSTLRSMDLGGTAGTLTSTLRPGERLDGTFRSTGGFTPSGSRALAGSGLDTTSRSVLGGGPSSLRRDSYQQPRLRHVVSVPSLGLKRLERPPVSLQCPPLSAGTSTMKLEIESEMERDKPIEAISRRLWTAAHGSELYIKEMMNLIKDEDPKASNQSILQKLSKTPVPAMNKAMKQGAKIDWRNREWDGATLLLKAVRTDSMSLTMYLLSLGADYQVTDLSGRGIFHWAACEGNTEMVEYFLTNYPELLPQSPDEFGDSPLHMAAYYGHLPIVRLFIRADAGPLVTNGGGFTALELAEARRMWHVVRYMSEFRQHEEDKHNKGSRGVRELVRACNLDRANLLLVPPEEATGASLKSDALQSELEDMPKGFRNALKSQLPAIVAQ
mmetsp:Transcript_47426/g.133867  ORF Transcript_47426/g.133867 Transcript_47426/m.133867 type:complete len:452 (-) Transcript_47426:183-1538(-)